MLRPLPSHRPLTRQDKHSRVRVMISFFIAAALSFTFGLPANAETKNRSVNKDCWMSAEASGKKDGSSQNDPYGPDKAQQCWDQTGPEGTMYVLPGEYTKKNKKFWRLRITEESSGIKGLRLKRLKGIGDVVLTGSRPTPYKHEQASRGETWIHIQKNAANLVIENFKVAKVAGGITADQGGNRKIFLNELHFSDTRQNIHIKGHPRCVSLADCPVTEEELSSQIIISHVTGIRYSKRHIRLGKGLHQVDVLHSRADSENLDGDFAVGFDVEGPAHDILFFRCVSKGNRYTHSEYWNGDGFKSEIETYSIRWINCEAYRNADGGFDIKTKGPLLRHIVASENKRNVRIWTKEGALLENIYAADSKNAGGVGSDSGIWTQGIVDCRYCTVKNNAVQALVEGEGKKAKITFYDSFVSTEGRTEAKLKQTEGKKSSVKFVRSEVKSNKKHLKAKNKGRIGYDKKDDEKSARTGPGEMMVDPLFYQMLSDWERKDGSAFKT